MFQLIQFLMLLFNQYLNKTSHDYFLVMTLPPVPLIINLTGVVDTTPVKLIGGSKRLTSVRIAPNCSVFSVPFSQSHDKESVRRKRQTVSTKKHKDVASCCAILVFLWLSCQLLPVTTQPAQLERLPTGKVLERFISYGSLLSTHSQQRSYRALCLN